MWNKLTAWAHLTWTQLHYSGRLLRSIEIQLIDMTADRDRLRNKLESIMWMEGQANADAAWLYEQRCNEIKKRALFFEEHGHDMDT